MKPRIRWHRTLETWLCHDKEPSDPISGKINTGTGLSPEQAYQDFARRAELRSGFLRLTPEKREFYESVYRGCLSPWQRLARFFTHTSNGSRRFP